MILYRDFDHLLKDLNERKQSFRQNVVSLAIELKEVRSRLASQEQSYAKETLTRQGESVSSTRARYQKVIKDFADKYPTENLLLVTHGLNCTIVGEGVGVSLSTLLKNAKVYAVEYCAYVELRHPIFQKGHSFASGEFNVTLARPASVGPPKKSIKFQNVR